MSLSDYELSLVADAKKGKKKALDRLYDALHKTLCNVIEQEIGDRSRSEAILRAVFDRLKTQVKSVSDPSQFEMMAIRETVTECKKYPRSDKPASESGASQFTAYEGQKKKEQPDPQPDVQQYGQQQSYQSGAQQFEQQQSYQSGAQQYGQQSHQSGAQQFGQQQSYQSGAQQYGQQSYQSGAQQFGQQQSYQSGAQQYGQQSHQSGAQQFGQQQTYQSGAQQFGQQQTYQSGAQQFGQQQTNQSGAQQFGQQQTNQSGAQQYGQQQSNQSGVQQYVQSDPQPIVRSFVKPEPREESPADRKSFSVRGTIEDISVPSGAKGKIEDISDSMSIGSNNLYVSQNPFETHQSNASARQSSQPHAQQFAQSFADRSGQSARQSSREPAKQYAQQYAPRPSQQPSQQYAQRPPRQPGANDVKGWLVCVNGFERGKDYPIISQLNRIGSLTVNEICIQGEPAVMENNHASISCNGSTGECTLTVAQRGSVRLNGTYVDRPVILKKYDTLTIGRSQFVYVPFSEGLAWKRNYGL